MGLWQKFIDTFLKREDAPETSEGEDAFISTSPYPKPDAHGEAEIREAEEGEGEPARGEGAP